MIPTSDSRPNLSGLKDYQNWLAANSDLTLATYASALLTPDLIIGLTAIIWPGHLQYEEGFFLSDGFKTTLYSQWSKKLGSDTNQIERIMNHTRV